MRRLGSLAVLALTTVSGCAPPAPRAVLPAPGPPLDARVLRVQVREGNATVVRDVPLEEYVAAAALSEFDPPTASGSAAEAMFEVQAIISRTYAASHLGRHARDGFDLCSTTHCQLYQPSRLRTSRWARAARDADERTRGEILWFGGAPALALYHADCGGHTSAAADVWGGNAQPYLVAEPDGGDARAAHARWRVELTREALRDALVGDARTDVGARLDRIDVVARDRAGRAAIVELRGTGRLEVRGETFREVVTRALGVKSLRSTLFTVRRTDGGFEFNGRGFGHGVGLCQAGAFARLLAGASPAAVLRYYFPGTSLR